MKKYHSIIVTVALAFLAGAFLFAQEKPADRATVPFSNPAKPGMVEIGVHNGGITVKGYDGKEVIVEAKVRERMVQEEKSKKDVKGLRLIRVPGGSGLEIEEEDNEMQISASSLRQTVDLFIQVPYNTSLELSAHNNGNIIVENVSGDIEANNHNGSLTLTGISGSVVANTFNGPVTVTFTKVDPGKPMSFSTWNGNIDVSFPANIKARVKMKSERGDVYSDFDIQLEKAPQKVEEDERAEGGGYRISFDKYIVGSINGGGPDYTFNNFNGDIYIRKSQ
ncbi:MAG: hypothetical protein JXB23_12205 [Candidatus Aminicenantes bacterium]|nr:hypothetical protein [Candidatus Aminicenantes bacterium]